VSRIRGEIESILRQLNLYPEGSSLRAVIDELKKDPRHLYTTIDAKDHDIVRERILQDYRNIIELVIHSLPYLAGCQYCM
jgi:uncharacterized protein (DUF885 family)